jgi:hypothetical protein
MLLSIVRTYWGGNTGSTLYKSYRRTYMGPLDIRYFLEYPLVNTWTYEIAFEPLDKNHQKYALWPDVHYFFGL